MCAGKFPWFGDCPCTDQAVTMEFARDYPDLITRGPAQIRRDNVF